MRLDDRLIFGQVALLIASQLGTPVCAIGALYGARESAACCEIRVAGEKHGFCMLRRVLLMTSAELDARVVAPGEGLKPDVYRGRTEIVVYLFAQDCQSHSKHMCSQYVRTFFYPYARNPTAFSNSYALFLLLTNCEQCCTEALRALFTDISDAFRDCTDAVWVERRRFAPRYRTATRADKVRKVGQVEKRVQPGNFSANSLLPSRLDKEQLKLFVLLFPPSLVPSKRRGAKSGHFQSVTPLGR